MSAIPITDDDLMAWADGQLAGERRASVEQALARDASLATRVAAIREQNAALRDAFDPWLDEAIPQRL
ncbi:MAG TPA: anti-sigma factor, partial [Casimicrobiaceae bacterium]|nr:anti-sigma factor [Casimicrobiaceae bacterium]